MQDFEMVTPGDGLLPRVKKIKLKLSNFLHFLDKTFNLQGNIHKKLDVFLQASGNLCWVKNVEKWKYSFMYD